MFVSIIAALGSQLDTETQKSTVVSGSGPNTIALVNIDGIIVENDSGVGLEGISSENSSARKLKKTLTEITKDQSVKALLVRVNSPGGSAVASEEIYQEILRYKEKTKQPVVVYFSDLAASGGYYVAMAADKIVANPSTITGSIGVIISYPTFGDLAEKYGVKNIVYKSGPHKDMVSTFREPDAQESAIMQSLITDSYENFVAAVSKGRKMPQEKVRQLGDGRIYSAKQAKEALLVDDIGNFETAIAQTRSLAGVDEASVIEFGKTSFWEGFLGSKFGSLQVSLLPDVSGISTTTKLGPRIYYLYNP